ncbi:MAG: hypothetical protein U0792_21060 [Gemmataceae bacterium]
MIAFLALWFVAKFAFVEFVISARAAKHNAEPIAAQLRERIPGGEPLYLFRLKDEGVLFYYARPAHRLHHPRELPPGSFAVLIQQEWEAREAFGDLELIDRLSDQQGDPLIVVRRPAR